MGINVKAKVNFNDIMVKLHKVAKDYADKRSGGKIILENLAFNDQNGTFLGGGEYCIFMKMQEGYATQDDKREFLGVVKEYVHYFVGEEESNYIDQDDLQPIYQGSTGEIPDDTSDSTSVSESCSGYNDGYGPGNGKILNMLFESEIIDEEENEDSSSEDNKCIGFGVMYDIDVGGKKDNSFKDAIQDKAKGLFGGVLADLRNIQIKIGGEPVNIGKIFDPQKWKEAIGVKDIDINQVPSDIVKAFRHDYPNNDINQSSVKVWGKDELVTQLNRQRKITPEIKARIGKADYSIQVEVHQKDPNYPKYNTKTIANTVSKALGTTYNAGIDWNKVKADDVIKIDDMTGLYKTKSNYEKPGSTNPPAKPKSKTNESEQNDAESKGNVKKDAENDKLLELVESEEYSEFASEKTTEQMERSKGAIGDGFEMQYVDSKECERYLQDAGVENTEFVDGILEQESPCIVGSVVKDLKEELGEGTEILSRLFEADEGDSEQQESPREMRKEAAMKGNPYEDSSENQEYHRKMSGMIDSEYAIRKIQNSLRKDVTTAYKNVFLQTKDKFEQLKDVKPDFKMFQTIVPVQDLKESQIPYGYGIMNLLFEGEGNNSPYNPKIQDNYVVHKNNELIGAILNIADWTVNKEQATLDIQSENVDKPSSTVKGKELQSKMGSRVHVTPYCVISETKRVIEYMKRHNIGDDSVYGRMTGGSEDNGFKYCAIVIKKNSLIENGDVVVNGGNGHQAMTDDKVQSVLDFILEDTENQKIDVINCKDQNKEAMNAKSGELLEQNLAYFNPKGKDLVPVLDVWVRPFNVPEKEPSGGKTETGSGNTYINIIQNITNNTQNNVSVNVNNVTVINVGSGNIGIPYIPVEMNVKIKFIFIMPDPIVVFVKTKHPNPEPTPVKDGNQGKDGGMKGDWYIIPHKMLRDLGDRPHQSSTDSFGVTTTKTSNAEYKPTNRIGF